MKATDLCQNSFYAAANTFDGFKSQFSNIFSPLEFDRIYILKGGPGTGKSTLMKKIAQKFENTSVVKRVHCSSDTHSLDGVIVKKGAKMIAILDGTAPHMTDPKLPVASEVIINLLDGLNPNKILSHKEEIIELNDKKSRSYDQAYSYMRSMGNIHDLIFKINANNGIYSLAESMISNIEVCHEDNKICSYEPSYLYSSAFGKDGYVFLDNKSDNFIRVSGDGFSEHIFMNCLKCMLYDRSILITDMTSPLTETDTDILFTEKCTVGICENDDFADIKTKCLTENLPPEYFELKSIYHTISCLAQKEFCNASTYHFALEKIYTESISFAYLDEVCNSLMTEIEQIII